MVTATMANTSTEHFLVIVTGDDDRQSLGFAIQEYWKKKDRKKFLYSWTVIEVPNSDQNDERIATQQASNQGGNAGINKS
jgi:hypothetical protein